MEDAISFDALIGAEGHRSLTAQKCGNGDYELGMKRKLEYEETPIGGSHETPNKRIRKYSPCDESVLRNLQPHQAKGLLQLRRQADPNAINQYNAYDGTKFAHVTPKFNNFGGLSE